jgi:hypothetical protein
VAGGGSSDHVSVYQRDYLGGGGVVEGGEGMCVKGYVGGGVHHARHCSSPLSAATRSFST